MAEGAQQPAAAAPPRRSRRPARFLSVLAKAAVGVLVAALLALGALFAFLDTDAGHRFLADRVAALSPSSGLKIRIGRIDGSIWGDTILRDVRVYDPKGLFAESPMIEADWQPLAWVTNRLVVDELTSELVILHRLPKLIPSAKPKPILPGFDIYVGRLDIAQLRFEKGVTGERRIARVHGAADVRSGRAKINLQAKVRDGGDNLAFLLDAEPDRDHFDLDVKLTAPGDGVAAALLGTKRPIALDVHGDGRWSEWAGTAELSLSGESAADLALRAEKGQFNLSGSLTFSQFLKGKLQRLSQPRILLNASATLKDRRLDGTLSLRSAALKLESKGVIDLARSGFDNVRIGADLLRPQALFTNMTGRAVRLGLLLDGPFGSAHFAYRLTTPHVAFDQTGFDNVRAEGRGQLSKPPVTVPIVFTARRVTGVGDVAGGILANLRVQGALKVTDKRLTGDGLTLASDKLKGKLSVFIDLVTGRYDVAVSGGLTRYFIPGLGIVDVTSELKVVPGAGGRGTLITGKGRAWVRRFDNRFLAGLAGGLPQIETDLVRGPDRILHFRNLRLSGPSIRLSGNGFRRNDGTFFFEGSGAQTQYGALALTLDGRIDRPKLAIRLERPNEAMGLAGVLLALDPTEAGFAYRAEGQSLLGPFTSHGAILLPKDQPALIQIAGLDVSGTHVSGTLRADPGALNGTLAIAGGGLDGKLMLSPVGEVQRIEAHLVANNARFSGPPPIAIRRGKLDGVFLLDPAGTSVEAKISATGLRRGGLSLASLGADVSMRGGRGQIRANVTGTRGRDFVFRTVAEVAPGRIAVAGEGTVDRRPIALNQPAVLTRAEGGGWRLAPTSLSFAGGDATVSGLFGGGPVAVQARMEKMPLTVLDIAWPRLGLGGIASGTLSYQAPERGGAPSGAVDMRIRGLTRSGLVLSSKPVDIGLVAKLDGRNAAMRAVAVSEGKTVGRAQARLSPIEGGGDLVDRLSRAPLFAQLRYNGPADTLWRLTGLELLDLSGPVAIGADATGTFNDPTFRGSVKTDKARLESAVTGTVIENIQASGRFGGSRLVIDSFAGTTKKGGKVAARGAFDFSAVRGVGMDIALTADAAQLIDRDDLKAQVTGPVTIRSDGSGGTIAGKVELVSGSFRLGSATAGAEIPRLAVHELNRPEDEAEPLAAPVPWGLDLEVHGDNRLMVTGLGITSEWGADLKIAGTVTEPRINGRADLRRGSYDFAGRRFDLERGTIRFVGESPVNPVLDIVAEGGIQGLNATIRVTGRGQKPEIAFTSTPALPQDELLSRLLFGTSITNLSAPEALQLAAAVASLNNTGGGLDPINSVRSAVGLDRLRVLPADIATGQGTSLAAGKYIGRHVYVEVITDGRGYSATQVEYQITRWLSILSSISTIGRESINVRVSKDY